MIARLLALAVLVLQSPSWANDSVYTYHSMVGQPMQILVEGGSISFRSADVVESSTECLESDYVLCFFSPVVDAAIPADPPFLNDAWELNGTRFEVITHVPSLTLLGSTYKDIHVIRATRSGVRRGYAAVRYTDLYYSYENGLIGFLYAHLNGEAIFLSSGYSGIVENP